MKEDIRWAIDEMVQGEYSLENLIKKVNNNIQDVKKLKEDPLTNLSDILEGYFNVSVYLSHLFAYTNMKVDEDARVSESQKKLSEVTDLGNKVGTTYSFFKPWLLSLSSEEQQRILNDEKLSRYHLFLNRIFRYKNHTLSETEENILSELSFTQSIPEDIYYFLENVDIKIPEVDGKKVTTANLTTLLMDEDRDFREKVYKTFYDTFKQYANTISTCYASNVKVKSKISKLRKFNSLRHESLFTDDVPEEVYDNLIDTIHEYLPYIHKYVEIRKRALKLDELRMYDVYMPIVDGVERQYTFEEAKEICIEAVKPLGEEYVNQFRKAFEENWIDAYPRDGKRGGAYSFGSVLSKPYILMNFQGTLDSIFTMIHEMGHSMHSYFSRTNNDPYYADYTIFTAEVASTFNENLLLHYLIKKANSEEEKKYLIDFYVDSFRQTVFRQTMFAEFEREVHKAIDSGQSLTSEDFDAIYLDLNKAYFGKEMVSDEYIAREWMRIPHFYSNFYVYKYATGFCTAVALSQRVLNGGEKERNDYINLLKDGSKHFPIEQLTLAGCNPGDRNTIKQSLDVMKDYIEQLDKLM